MPLLENENIICISNTTWEGPYTKSVVQLMSQLALKNRVMFVEYPYTVKDVVTTLLGKQHAPVARMLGLKSRIAVRTTPEGATVYNFVPPPIIPLFSLQNEALYRLVLKADMFLYRLFLNRAAKKLKMNGPLIINAYNPVLGEALLGRLNEKASVYYCYDGFPKDRRGIRSWNADRAYSAIADGIIVSSDYLKEQKMEFNSRVFTVKNGVDFDLFNRAARTSADLGRERKKIGYIGSIDQRFDLETVEFSVRNLPGFDFEFIGDVRNATVKNTLEPYPNVQFLPPVKPSEVPERLNQCDAGIIPYLCNEINKNVYPLKINEYLAVGVPVVITRFADLPEFKDQVASASTKEEFLDCLKEVTGTDSEERIRSRTGFARSNSWKSRADLFSMAVASSAMQKTIGTNPK